MTKNESAEIIELAKKYNSEVFLQNIAREYGDNFDLESIHFSNLSLLQLYTLSIKVINQFITTFDDIAFVLPMSFTHPNYGSSTVALRLENFLYEIDKNSFDLESAEAYLLWLILYQIEYGFF